MNFKGTVCNLYIDRLMLGRWGGGGTQSQGRTDYCEIIKICGG